MVLCLKQPAEGTFEVAEADQAAMRSPLEAGQPILGNLREFLELIQSQEAASLRLRF